MSEFKGTKGKWNYEVVKNSSCKISIADTSFAEIYLPHNADDITEMQYNALLISKAPEMLEMIQILLGDIEKGPVKWTRQEKITMARKLIKEATEL